MKRLIPLVFLLQAMRGGEPPVTATFSCAPNDGRAIELRCEVSETAVVYANIWGQGLGQMRAGHAAFKLDYDHTGQATLCPRGGICRVIPARLEFDVSGTREGDKLRGRLFYTEGAGPEKLVPFAVPLRRPKGGGPYCG